MEGQYNRMEGEERGTASEAEPSKLKQCCKKTGKIAGAFLCVVFVLAVLVQAICYWWASMKCSASHLAGYEYPGGGPDNLVPYDSLIIEQEPHWWGQSMMVLPADKVGLADGASTGVYFRTWGPFFYTYVYQDVLGMQTFVIRDRPIALGGSHKVMRCDGQGPTYVVSEGGHYLMNLIRATFGMYTSRVYNIWQDNELVALSEKLGGSGTHKQLIFRDPKKAEPFASSFLADRHYHGYADKWFVQVTPNTTLPAFIPNGATMLMAFITANQKRAQQAKEQASSDSAGGKPTTLVEAQLSDLHAGIKALQSDPHFAKTVALLEGVRTELAPQAPTAGAAAGAAAPAEEVELAADGAGAAAAAQEPASAEQPAAEAAGAAEAAPEEAARGEPEQHV